MTPSADYPMMLRNKIFHGLHIGMGTLAVLTGFLSLGLILYQYRPNKYHVTWEYMLFAKVAVSLFLTRITDWIVMKMMVAKGTTLMDDDIAKDFYFYTSVIKFLAMIVIVILSTASKFYREEITNNFIRKGEEYVGDEYRPMMDRIDRT